MAPSAMDLPLLIRNIGTLVSGDISDSARKDDAILIESGHIKLIGQEDAMPVTHDTQIVDAEGTTVCPGFIDSHVHLVLGDYTPRQQAIGFIESYVHGGITTFISASEVHAQGRPHDPIGVKALAITAQRCFSNFRPLGARLWGGSVILEPGLSEADFEQLEQAGVWLAKAGFGQFPRPRDVAPLVRMAQEHGMKVMCHTGGASIPGSSSVTAKDLLAMQPDVAGHANGGTTSLSNNEMQRLVSESSMALQISQAGNLRAAIALTEMAESADCLERVIFGSDTPTGTGVMPLGILKSVAELSSLTSLPPEMVLAMATGNNARAYGLPTGIVEVGSPADLVIMDAPLGSHQASALDALAVGDVPGISLVVIAGKPAVWRSRNTPPARRFAKEVHPQRAPDSDLTPTTGTYRSD